MAADEPQIPADTWSVGGPLPPRVLGGRWQLDGPPFAQGASGVVYRATDLQTGGTAAVKLLHPMSTNQRVRVRREITALRVLRLPGVVQLLDQGEDGDQHYIVMELVGGAPFPGNGVARTWEELSGPALALLHALSRVHASGVVHRDLKPANVLVDPGGRLLLLDFGLARGPALGTTITGHDQVLGTPRYLAPEQLDGQLADARADLYAVGVMLFEHLSGRLPHHADTIAELYANRLAREAVAIEHFVPEVPAPAARLVNALLRRSLQERPRSATEAILLLGDSRPAPAFRRLGDGAIVEQLVLAAREHRSLAIDGEPGSGRSRALRDAAEILVAEGREVRFASPASRPFESLQGIVALPGNVSDSPSRVAATLRERLAGGLVLVVDDVRHIDRWSSRMVEQERWAGTVLAAEPGGVPVPPLSEADLRAAFFGPDRLLHLAEDAARELYRRAGGLPGRVLAELEAWIVAGLATEDGGRIRIERGALEQLAGGLRVEPLLVDARPRTALDSRQQDLLAWVAITFPLTTASLLYQVTDMPAWEIDAELAELHTRGEVRRLPDGRWETVHGTTAALMVWEEERRRAAHQAIARVLPPCADGRLVHLSGAGDLAEAAREALLLARRLKTEGHLARALGAIEVGLLMTRQLPGADEEEELLVEATVVAVIGSSPEAVARARHGLETAGNRTPLLTACFALLDAFAAASAGRGEEAAARLSAAGSLPNPALEEVRRTLIYVTVRPGDIETLARVAADAAHWAGVDRRRLGRVATWQARQRYREERYLEAAELHEEGARLLSGADQLNALLGCAAALLGALQFNRAILVAEQCRATAYASRLAYYEARAEWVIRSAAYRRGDAMEVDEELVSVASSALQPWTRAQVLVGEAAIAWRGGQLRRARELAVASRIAWRQAGFGAAELLAAALAFASGEVEGLDGRSLAGAAAACLSRGLALQSLALVCSAAPDLEEFCRVEIEARVRAIPRVDWDSRLEVLAPREALSYCSGLARRNR